MSYPSQGNPKKFRDNQFTLQDDGDPTKQLQFQASGITTATTRTLTAPDASDTIVCKATTDTLTNKTFDAEGTGNSLSNVKDANIKAAAGIAKSKISTSSTWAIGDIPTITEVTGGTNQTTYTLGDLLYSSASNTLAKLAGNITATKKFLNQTGNGSVSAAPAWAALVAGDIPDISATYMRALASETNTSPVAGGNDTVLNTTNTYFSYFTVPSSFSFYQITGMECLNGTVVAGNFQMSLHYVNANPPSSSITRLCEWFGVTVQTGTSQIQRVTIDGRMVAAGQILGAAIVSNSATARYGTTTVGSSNRLKATAYSSAGDLAVGSTTAISAGTEEPYLKVYLKGVG